MLTEGRKQIAKSGAVQWGANCLSASPPLLPAHVFFTVALSFGLDASLSGKPLCSFVSLCREVGNMLQEIPYNFTGKEAVNRGGWALESADLASNPGSASCSINYITSELKVLPLHKGVLVLPWQGRDGAQACPHST